MQVQFLINVEIDDNGRARATIACDTQPIPFTAMMIATEHLMTATAMGSGHRDGFEGALNSLCDGARANKLLEYGGKKVQ